MTSLIHKKVADWEKEGDLVSYELQFLVEWQAQQNYVSQRSKHAYGL